MAERRVRIAQLPEMRLAYLEHRGPVGEIPALWERFNAWRLEARPAVGRVDIAQIGWLLNPEAGETDDAEYRACIPVRSDYEATGRVRTTFFPGGLLAYSYADDVDEIEAALSAVSDWIDREGGWHVKGVMEVYRYHFNLDQHPADCGFLIERI